MSTRGTVERKASSTRWRVALVFAWIALGALFAFLIHTARESLIAEIRSHAMGVAAATASGLSAADLDAVHGPADMDSPAYHRVQQHLDSVARLLPDIRYAYTMRPDPSPGAKPTDFLYIVDASPDDANGNGVIDPDEISEEAGNAYDASEYPEMLAALNHPSADHIIRPDPPYPDLMSGYAPVRDASGRTAGIVGVDITAEIVRAKLLGVYGVNIGCYVLLSVLMALVATYYHRQKTALDENQALSRELAARNETLAATNHELARRNEQMQAELRLAQQVQLGFLPREFPRSDRLRFDRFYITSEILGGDLFDVFDIDGDRVGLYMADVAGHGVSAALISGLLKMAVTSLREKSAGAREGEAPAMIQPGQVLARLNEVLLKEIPDSEFITMIYAVLDLRANTVSVASAGHPPPFLVQKGSASVSVWKLPNGMAMGLEPAREYRADSRGMSPGDCLVFYTDGLIEAMNEAQEEFGEERSLDVLRRSAKLDPAEMLRAMRKAVEQHRAGAAVSDDFSLLVCEFF